jgi:hypothetical protein
MFPSDSGGTADTRPLRCSNVALGRSTAKAPTSGLSKLNSMAFGLAVYASPGSLPPPAQDSLPAAGQALPDGLSTRKVPTKGFRIDPQTTRIFSGCRPTDDTVIIGISALCKLADWLETRALVADQGGRKCLPTPQEGSPPAPTANVQPNSVGAALARGTVGENPARHAADAQPRDTATTCHPRHAGSGVDFTGDTDAKQDDTNNHVTSNRKGGDV